MNIPEAAKQALIDAAKQAATQWAETRLNRYLVALENVTKLMAQQAGNNGHHSTYAALVDLLADMKKLHEWLQKFKP